MIHIAICEDDITYLCELEKIIKENKNLSVEVHSCSSPEERFKLYETGSTPYDIVLMDIELPEKSGIILSKEIQQTHPATQIIFITQYREYCSDVYETEHVYFIHKSDAKQYLPRAIKKAIFNLEQQKNNYLTISWNRREHNILLDDIIYMERNLRTTTIYCTSSTYYTSEKLTDLLNRLDQNFACCHRSYLINLNQITDFENNLVTLAGKHKIPVSQKRADEVKGQFLAMFMKR
ncbi:LytR/AlgR family response regulator transcription factor [Anaerostipes hadrus]|uniref:Stage 0 sporulation protein A homolog n=1 Tax=Anaerostipes hadrus TaxID=649756 RepID=A0A1Q2C7B7_ANAHA|nr:LytTR family DNA-binding domain-containing protein [Anaerostipes hadrus]AQP39642.1 hypothetical protein DO83_08630 [Anaerostipes hadrus]